MTVRIAPDKFVYELINLELVSSVKTPLEIRVGPFELHFFLY